MEKLNLLDTSVNMSKMARAQSIMSGATSLLSGMKHIKDQPKSALVKSLLGGYLIYRGITGHCPMNQVMGRNTA